MKQNIVISENLERSLVVAISECQHDRVFVLTDETTKRLCWPKLSSMRCMQEVTLITIPATDTNKNLESLALVWDVLSKGGATRHSLLINLGGGMVTDLGGFAAATFKRGIDFINIPTTLLAMVDASVGGKTGVNFNGLKNEIGVFADARFVIISTLFLDTLDMPNLCSGYAEMLKHCLINDERMWAELVGFSLHNPDFAQLQRMVGESIAVKERIVQQDPHEKGLRKALNLGHTIGHAIESFAMEQGRPMLHGYAVAYGLMGELYLSVCKTAFPVYRLRQTARFIREAYGTPDITCDDYPKLLELMKHDKKNTSGTINFSLLANIGDVKLNQTASEEEIKEALDFIREG